MTIKMKVIPYFPSEVRGDGIVTVTKSNGAYIIGIDFLVLADADLDLTTGDDLRYIAYNIVTEEYQLLRLIDALTAGLDPTVSTFLDDPTSANLKAAVTDETGSGPLVFGTSPNITTPTGIVKGDVGLGNVDNTSDANKPVSTAQATADALNLKIASNLSDLNNAATARTNLGVAIGVNVQAYDAELAALAGLTSAADKLPYFSGSATAALADFSTFGRSLVDDADAAAARSTLGLVIGTNVQAYDAELAAIAGLTSAADRVAYFTGSGTASLATFTTFGRSLVDDADASAARTTLGVVIGTDVQAYDADLAALAANSTAGLWAYTGAGTGSARTITGTANEVTVTNGAGTAGNPTVSLPSALTLTGKTLTGGTFASADLSAGTNTFPTFNQNTTGSAAKWTTARNLAGNSVDGSANVAFANKFIVQGTTDAGLSAAQFLGALGTGIVKNTTTTGALSIAIAADFPTLNQNTTGSAATLTTSRNIDGVAFNGSADITVIAPGTHAATSKATPVDADELPLVDSAASNVLKRLTWANLKATAKTYFDTLYQPLDSSAWTSYTPTVSANSGTFTTASATGKYKVLPGKTVVATVTVSITTVGTGSQPRFTLPVTPAAQNIDGVGHEDAVTGRMVRCSLATSLDNLVRIKYGESPTEAAASGATIICTIIYEAA